MKEPQSRCVWLREGEESESEIVTAPELLRIARALGSRAEPVFAGPDPFPGALYPIPTAVCTAA